MNLSKRIGFIGAGNMAGAIISGIISQNRESAELLYVYDPDQTKCEKLAIDGINISHSNKELVNCCDLIFLAIKPQIYESVLSELQEISINKKIWVTIAAGISCSYIQSFLGNDAKIIRAMPNTPLLLGCGATALCRGVGVSSDEFDIVKEVFETSGSVEVLSEDKMNSVISVNGSSPAYVYLFAKSVIDGAVAQGIDEQVAKALIAKTLIGSAMMITDSGLTPDELIKMVSSPGGTTLKALDVLYENNFEQIVKDAMLACTKRAEELSKG